MASILNAVWCVMRYLTDTNVRAVGLALLVVLSSVACSSGLPQAPKTHADAFSPIVSSTEAEARAEEVRDSTAEIKRRDWWLARPRFEGKLFRREEGRTKEEFVRVERSEFSMYSSVPWPLIRRRISVGEPIHVRSTVWPSAATVMSVGVDSIRIESTRIPLGRHTRGDFRCESSGAESVVRMVATLANHQEQAVVRTSFDFVGAEQCAISARAYDRLSAFATDVVVNLYRIIR